MAHGRSTRGETVGRAKRQDGRHQHETGMLTSNYGTDSPRPARELRRCIQGLQMSKWPYTSEADMENVEGAIKVFITDPVLQKR